MTDSALLVYQAHPLTGEYVGPLQADPDPLDDGNWLIPAMAFADAPPAAVPGFAIAHIPGGDKIWHLVPDHRGTVYQIETGRSEQWDELGPLPQTFTSKPFPGHGYRWDGHDWVLDDDLRQAALVAAERIWRDGEIERVKWLRERHRDEVDSARPTTLTPTQSGELLDYVQALRDWPVATEFPNAEHRPSPPDWIVMQSQ